MSRATFYRRAGDFAAPVAGYVTLEHDDRHLRRKLLALDGGGDILVDLPAAVSLEDGDALMLENGKAVVVRAAPEPLIEITAKTPEALSQLCWHIGNRHLPAQIERDFLRIRRDHVIAQMLTGLGAEIREITAPFKPLRGAYHAHGSHGHQH